MKTCPYCAHAVSDSARTCTMCGTGLPDDLPTWSRSIAPAVIAITLVAGLGLAAFLYEEWRAETTAITAAIPVDPPARAHPAKTGPPAAGEPSVAPESVPTTPPGPSAHPRR